MSSRTVLGLDLSLRATGMVMLTGKRVRTAEVYKPVAQKDQARFYRYAEITRAVGLLIADRNADLVVIESYSMASRGSSYIQLVELGAWVRGLLWRKSLSFAEVPPATLKAWVTDGVPHADKLRMKEHALRKWSAAKDNWDDNVMDAFCLAQLGMQLLQGTEDKRLKRLVVYE